MQKRPITLQSPVKNVGGVEKRNGHLECMTVELNKTNIEILRYVTENTISDLTIELMPFDAVEMMYGSNIIAYAVYENRKKSKYHGHGAIFYSENIKKYHYKEWETYMSKQFYREYFAHYANFPYLIETNIAIIKAISKCTTNCRLEKPDNGWFFCGYDERDIDERLKDIVLQD